MQSRLIWIVAELHRAVLARLYSHILALGESIVYHQIKGDGIHLAALVMHNSRDLHGLLGISRLGQSQVHNLQCRGHHYLPAGGTVSLLLHLQGMLSGQIDGISEGTLRAGVSYLIVIQEDLCSCHRCLVYALGDGYQEVLSS